MKKALFLLCIVVLFVSPSAFACATCLDNGDCDFFDGIAAYCWFDWQEPQGPSTCYTTGRCGPLHTPPPSLSAELTLASVEIRQGDTVIAQTINRTTSAPERTARADAPAHTARLAH